MIKPFPHRNLPTIPEFTGWKIRGGVYVHDDAFHKEVLAKAHTIDAVTYTYTAKTVDALPVRRVLAVIGNLPVAKAELLLVKNLHTKLYLVYTEGGSYEAWTGSMNLVEPSSWHNLMVRASASQAESLLIYFNRLWSLAKIATAENPPSME